MQRIESLRENLIKCQQCRRIISLQECIHQRETVFIIQYIQVAQHILIFHVGAAEGYRLVEYGKRITHRSVCLVGNHMK